MGIAFSDDEAWDEITRAHTGIVTTLRRDGWPVSLPVWFAVIDRRIYLHTPGRSKKVARIRHDDRATFLVERGERWVELSAVLLPVRASILDDPDESAAVTRVIRAKYAGFGMPAAKVPDSAKRTYSGGVAIRLEPAGPFVSWDNARLRLRT